MSDKPTVQDVKATLTATFAARPHADAYTASLIAFAELYGRSYTGKDRPELERIKYHARHMMAGQSAQWGGVRAGAGIKKAQEATE